MHFVSTRAPQGARASLELALNAGLAPDGGLYVPEWLPMLDPTRAPTALNEVAAWVLAPFLGGSSLATRAQELCTQAFDFPLPLLPIPGTSASVLELFHGPTAAFKDFGARFLAAALEALRRPEDPPTTILVATSGDTGGAVAGAFHGRAGFRVVILYPDGLVSARQAHQLAAWGDNIACYRVAGRFDDCQRLVKGAFADAGLRSTVRLASANSISLGRLLPQMSYYAWSALTHWRRTGSPANYIIPTGNLGNAVACLLARSIGLPIGEVVLAANANRVLSDFYAGGGYQPQASLATLANAMDVGDPSNFERMRWLFPPEGLGPALSAGSVDDAEIRSAITRVAERHDYVLCPHTACAWVMLERLRAAGDLRHWIVVGTAHPAKFETVVEPLIGRALDVPAPLEAILSRPARAERLGDDAAALRALLMP